MVELWFARTWIVIAAGFVAAVNFVAVWVLFVGVRFWRDSLRAWAEDGRKTAVPDINTNIMIFSIVASLLDLVMFGIMNVGQATTIVTDSRLEGIAWLYLAVLVPLVTGKTLTKVSSAKYGSTETPPPPPQSGGNAT